MISVLRHVLESSVVALLLLLAAFALRRRSSAAARHLLLLCAALTFAVPLEALLALGTWLRSLVPASSVTLSLSPQLPAILASSSAARTPAQIPGMLMSTLLALWLVGAALAITLWLSKLLAPVDLSGVVPPQAAHSLLRLRAQLGLSGTVRLMASPKNLEPCLRGWWRPTIVLPEALVARVTPEELDAILLHELAHLRRHDNLSRAVVHALRCVFWFYPLLAWLERRIDIECELACDDLVLSFGVAPRPYLDAILHVCQLCTLGSLPGSSNVVGSHLSKRMEFIMTFPSGASRTRTSALLAGLSLPAIVAVAVFTGFATAAAGHAQTEASQTVAGQPASPAIRCLFAGNGYPQGAVVKQGLGPQQMCVEFHGGPLWVRTSDEARERTRQLVLLPQPKPIVCKPTAPDGDLCTCNGSMRFSPGGSALSEQGAILSCAAGGTWQTLHRN